MLQYLKNISRNILKNKISYIGAIFIITLRVLIFISINDFILNFREKVELYYDDSNFADVFAEVEGMPSEKLKKLEEIEGIDTAFGRIEYNARVLLDGNNDLITLHIMAYSPEDTLNQIKFDDKKAQLGNDEIYISNRMAEKYNFKIGDEIKIIIGNRSETMIYSGNARSPEYMVIVPEDTILASDQGLYDMAAMDKARLEKLTGMQNTVTNIGIRLKDGYSFAEVREAINRELEPYGINLLYERKNQLSYNAINEELGQYNAACLILPAMFLLVSIFMLYIILKKIIDKDRIIIGTMKAFGATDLELLTVYIMQAFFIGGIGGVLAMFIAHPFGKYLFDDDIIYYNIPFNQYTDFVNTRVIGLLIALVTSIIATYIGVSDVLKINPAESMRAKGPETKGKFKLPKILNYLLNQRQKIGIRSILRALFRNFVIMLAVAFSFSMISTFSSFDKIINQMSYDQFNKIETYDLKLSLENYVIYDDALRSVENIKGIKNTEAIASFNINMRHNNLSRYGTMLALNPNSKVYKIMDNKYNYYQPRDDGIILSTYLAKKLNVKKGDVIEISNPYLSKKSYIQIPVVEIVKMGFGTSSYISMDGIERYFNKKKMSNLIVFNVDEGKMESVKSQLNNTKNISFAIDTERTLDKYVIMMQSMMLLVSVFSIFSFLAGVIMIYNIINISIRERFTEFGTLMILGMSNSEISEIVCFEQGINFIFGIIIGLICDIPFAKLMENIFSVGASTIVVRLGMSDYLFGFICCLLIMTISLIFIIKNIRGINLVDILKERG